MADSVGPTDPPVLSARLLHHAAEPMDFDPSRTYQQRTRSFHKPIGLWVSVEGPDDWQHWCEGEGFASDRFEVTHQVTLAPGHNVLWIWDYPQFDDFHRKYQVATDEEYMTGRYIDWELVAEHYDGLIIAPYHWRRRMGNFDDPDAPDARWYYGWDCASGCIWNLAAIESVTVL